MIIKFFCHDVARYFVAKFAKILSVHAQQKKWNQSGNQVYIKWAGVVPEYFPQIWVLFL